jgi:hypothetical protein
VLGATAFSVGGGTTMTGCRRAGWWLALALLVGSMAVVGVGVFCASEQVGLGGFDQTVAVEADRPVARVLWDSWTVGEADRVRAERTADPALFDYRPATQAGDGRYVVRIRGDVRTGPCAGRRTYFPAHLAVLVEFADGTRACRVLELPPGEGRQVVTVRVP